MNKKRTSQIAISVRKGLPETRRARRLSERVPDTHRRVLCAGYVEPSLDFEFGEALVIDLRIFVEGFEKRGVAFGDPFHDVMMAVGHFRTEQFVAVRDFRAEQFDIAFTAGMLLIFQAY